MPEILETLMLVCFGMSWPMNVYRNYKARSAKGMSLFFILLIISGYVAGIGAKILTHNFTYVLAVYALNLLFVSINLLVKFISVFVGLFVAVLLTMMGRLSGVTTAFVLVYQLLWVLAVVVPSMTE